MPIPSSLMESVVKQVNLRVQGTEQFWSAEGAEAIPQLRADLLSDDQPLGMRSQGALQMNRIAG